MAWRQWWYIIRGLWRGTATHPIRQSAAALPGNLKRLREAKGWSVRELAERAQVSVTTIREIEANDRGFGDIKPNPRLSTLLALARALGCGIEELVEEGGK